MFVGCHCICFELLAGKLKFKLSTFLSRGMYNASLLNNQTYNFSQYDSMKNKTIQYKICWFKENCILSFNITFLTHNVLPAKFVRWHSRSQFFVLKTNSTIVSVQIVFDVYYYIRFNGNSVNKPGQWYGQMVYQKHKTKQFYSYITMKQSTLYMKEQLL